jgi:hypothetical protein
MRRFALTLAGLSMLVLAAPVQAQEAQEAPETRVLTMTAFHVPFGQKMAGFMEFADEYMVPPAAEDPYILMFRVATHYWGTTDVTVWLMTEYASLTDMELSNDWQSEWYEQQYPEGTPEREAADEAFQKEYISYFAVHEDHILNVNMNRAK